MRVISTSSGLMAVSEEMAYCKEPVKVQTGKQRRRSDRKRFKEKGYIERTLERGMILNQI